MVGVEGVYFNGAFTSGGSHNNWNKGHNYASASNAVNFDASNSNSIYGASKTVTPLSRKCLFLIKF